MIHDGGQISLGRPNGLDRDEGGRIKRLPDEVLVADGEVVQAASCCSARPREWSRSDLRTAARPREFGLVRDLPWSVWRARGPIAREASRRRRRAATGRSTTSARDGAAASFYAVLWSKVLSEISLISRLGRSFWVPSAPDYQVHGYGDRRHRHPRRGATHGADKVRVLLGTRAGTRHLRAEPPRGSRFTRRSARRDYNAAAANSDTKIVSGQAFDGTAAATRNRRWRAIGPAHDDEGAAIVTVETPSLTGDLAQLEAMWTRLVTIANECWVATYRSAYSTIISEALDIGCELLDANGGSLAHGTKSIPVFNMIMPGTVRSVLAKYGGSIEEGDVFITNDPWICAGHLPDIAVVTPVFRSSRLVAFIANVANVSDIGGNLNRPFNEELFDEGLQIPVLRLCSRGSRVPTMWEMLLANVRTPEEVEGDLEAMMSGNALASQRLLGLMGDWNIESFDKVSSDICAFSEAAMRKAIEKLPDGVGRAEWTADGFGSPIKLRIEVRVDGREIHVSFPDAPSQVDKGAFNCTMNYTQAHVNYALKCLLAPAVPTNAGCFRPISVDAAEGTVFNCRRPAAVDMRTRIGWQVHPLVFRAMARFLPTGVPAGCGQPSLISMDGRWASGTRFQEHLILGAGMGAWSGGDGENNSTYPSSAASGSIEILEHRSPVLVEWRSLAAGSGGRGRYRGGAGEEVSLTLNAEQGRSVRVVTALERMLVAPYGLAGGVDGSVSALIPSGERTERSVTDRVFELLVGEHLTIRTAGGGGYGDELG